MRTTRTTSSRRTRKSRPTYPLALQLRTAISRKRRLVAAALLSLAAALIILVLSPGDRDTVPVVVAAKSLGAGTVLASGDLTVAQYPVDLVPAGNTENTSSTSQASAVDGSAEVISPPASSDRVEDWVGRTLSTAVVEGQPLTVASVVGPDLLAGQPAGTTAVTVRVADPGALTHLRPGQRVDLVHRSTTNSVDQPEPSPSSSPEADANRSVVARDVTVLWVADPVEPSTGFLSSAGGSEQDLLVVGADSPTAQAIAASDTKELVPVLVALNPSGEAAAP